MLELITCVATIFMHSCASICMIALFVVRHCAPDVHAANQRQKQEQQHSSSGNSNCYVGSDSAAAVLRFFSVRLSGMRRKWFSFLLLNYSKTNKQSVLAMMVVS